MAPFNWDVFVQPQHLASCLFLLFCCSSSSAACAYPVFSDQPLLMSVASVWSTHVCAAHRARENDDRGEANPSVLRSSGPPSHPTIQPSIHPSELYTAFVLCTGKMRICWMLSRRQLLLFVKTLAWNSLWGWASEMICICQIHVLAHMHPWAYVNAASCRPKNETPSGNNYHRLSHKFRLISLTINQNQINASNLALLHLSGFPAPLLTAAGRWLMMDFVINEVKFEWIVCRSRVDFRFCFLSPYKCVKCSKRLSLVCKGGLSFMMGFFVLCSKWSSELGFVIIEENLWAEKKLMINKRTKYYSSVKINFFSCKEDYFLELCCKQHLQL